MKSVIHKSEVVGNKNRRFGALTEYFPVEIVDANGARYMGLFTQREIEVAERRAEFNPEDVEQAMSNGLLGRLLAWLKL